MDKRRKHGFGSPKNSAFRFYRTFMHIHDRCYNKNCKSYKDYGEKGVKVCARWYKNFENFHQDMFLTWKKGLTIERKNVFGDYSPENCCWIPKIMQSRNKRDTKLYLFENKYKTLGELAVLFNINYASLHRRIKYMGMSLEDALSIPMKKAQNTKIDGSSLTVPECAKKYNLPYRLVYKRWAAGWDLNKIINTPIDKMKSATMRNKLAEFHTESSPTYTADYCI